jgi:hypothetical protein
VKTSGQSLIPQAMPPNLCHLEHRLNKRERVKASAKDPDNASCNQTASGNSHDHFKPTTCHPEP